MDIKKEFATDKVAENEGIWEEIGDGAKVLVARVGNKKWEAAMERLRKPHLKSLRRRGRLQDEVAEKITIEAMAEALLLDWEGIEEEGEVVAYSKENATRFLTDYPEFRNMVYGIASDAEVYRQELLEDAAGNSADT